MPRTRQPIRKRGPKLKVGWFINLIGGLPKYWNTVERFGMTPQEFQKILHERAAYLNTRFLLEKPVRVRSHCEGDFLAFYINGEIV